MYYVYVLCMNNYNCCMFVIMIISGCVYALLLYIKYGFMLYA